MKLIIAASKDSDGVVKAEYVGTDGQAADNAAKSAAKAGREAFIYIKPPVAKRIAADPVVSTKSKK